MKLQPSDEPIRNQLELLRLAPLVTGRYGKFRPELGVAIRATVGYPRFWRHGKIEYFAKAITPYGVFGRDDMDASAKKLAYLARLHDMAHQAIGELYEAARARPGEQLVVLCYEDVHAGQECHRRWFADWAESRFGLVVPELPAS